MKLAVSIPIYNQPALLLECLESFKQNNFSGKIYLFDDCSVVSYAEVLKQIQQLQIVYEKNQYNLGALFNMQHAFNKVAETHDYLMIMHEDDLLLPDFFNVIKNAGIKFSEKKPALIISCFYWFNQLADIPFAISTQKKDFKWIKKNELVALFLKNYPIAFGSAIYDTKKYKTMALQTDQYGEFADRPFLLSTLNDTDDILLIQSPLYGYRSHGIDDKRWKILKPAHVFNLLDVYKKILAPKTREAKRNYKKLAMSFVVDSYQNLQLSENNPFWVMYLLAALIRGHFSLKYVLLKNHTINSFFTWLKSKA